MPDQPQANTDRELWREVPGDYYSPSIHVTEGHGIGINVGGSVFVKPVREWHKLAAALPPNAPTAADDEYEGMGDKAKLPPLGAPTAAERTGEEPRPAPGSPAAFRYAIDHELATLRRQYGLRSDIKSHWICLLIDEVEALRSALLAARRENERVHGVTWVLMRDDMVLLERCPKKARVLGVGEWFVPGGKIEGGETEAVALMREIREEWPSVRVESFNPLPLLEGSPVPPGPRGLFLMRPYVITVSSEIPATSSEGIPLGWFTVEQALSSPVPQVRMMVAAALAAAHGDDR